MKKNEKQKRRENMEEVSVSSQPEAFALPNNVEKFKSTNNTLATTVLYNKKVDNKITVGVVVVGQLVTSFVPCSNELSVT